MAKLYVWEREGAVYFGEPNDFKAYTPQEALDTAEAMRAEGETKFSHELTIAAHGAAARLGQAL
jgi:hypothetical protein